MLKAEPIHQNVLEYLIYYIHQHISQSVRNVQ